MPNDIISPHTIETQILIEKGLDYCIENFFQLIETKDYDLLDNYASAIFTSMFKLMQNNSYQELSKQLDKIPNSLIRESYKNIKENGWFEGIYLLGQLASISTLMKTYVKQVEGYEDNINITDDSKTRQVLYYLFINQIDYASNIGNTLNIKSPNLSKIINKLYEKQLINYQKIPDQDPRKNYFTLSSYGTLLCRKAFSKVYTSEMVLDAIKRILELSLSKDKLSIQTDIIDKKMVLDKCIPFDPILSKGIAEVFTEMGLFKKNKFLEEYEFQNFTELVTEVELFIRDGKNPEENKLDPYPQILLKKLYYFLIVSFNKKTPDEAKSAYPSGIDIDENKTDTKPKDSMNEKTLAKYVV